MIGFLIWHPMAHLKYETTQEEIDFRRFIKHVLCFQIFLRTSKVSRALFSQNDLENLGYNFQPLFISLDNLFYFCANIGSCQEIETFNIVKHLNRIAFGRLDFL